MLREIYSLSTPETPWSRSLLSKCYGAKNQHKTPVVVIECRFSLYHDYMVKKVFFKGGVIHDQVYFQYLMWFDR